MRWQLLDKIEVLQKGRYARAVKAYSGKEDLFAEHYPGKPVVPEPLLIEMIAQAGGILYGLGLDFKKEVILAKIAKAGFPYEVEPPCAFVIEARITDEREEGAWITGVVRSGAKVVAEAEMLLVTMPSLVEGQQGSVVFTKSFLEHYHVYEVARQSEVPS